jgi:hypothetical protein
VSFGLAAHTQEAVMAKKAKGKGKLKKAKKIRKVQTLRSTMYK